MTKTQMVLVAKLQAIEACSRLAKQMEPASPEEIQAALEELAKQVAELSGNPIL